MKIRLKAASYPYIVVIVLGMVSVISGINMVYFKSKLLPIALGATVVVLALIGLWRAMRSDTTETDETSVEVDGFPLVPVVWLAGFFLVIYLLGFMIAIPLFVFTYMKTHGVRWLTTVISTIAATGFIYLLFEVLLEVGLYWGILLD